MAEAQKPFNKLKPFKRINNEAFRPGKKPNGKGVASGCRTPVMLGDIDKKLDAFIEDSPLIGPVLKAKKFIDDLLTPAVVAQKLFEALKEEVGPVLAVILTTLIMAAGGPVIVLLQPVKKLIDSVLGPVEVALRAMARVLVKPVLLRTIRLIPQWVPIEPSASNDSVTKDQVIEVEGLCTRSFGNPIDAPLINWHTWFNWNIQVAPEPEYAKALADVADPPNTEGKEGSEQSIIKPGSFEIQWDAGALQSAGDRQAFTSGFPDPDIPKHDGPMINPLTDDTILQQTFIWPMAGMFVWASGRHVYDCSRVTDAKSADPGMCAMINPARAIATARWQAHVFPENGTFAVPAIEFLFVACKRGGYINHDALADSDYEFILDLPPVNVEMTPFPIHHTDKVPHNTIVIRPRLLKRIEFIQNIDGAKFEPKLEVIRPEDPSKAPSQVKITIPQSALASVEAYGFKLSLGWFDPSRTEAKKVKLCRLEINSMRMRMTQRDSPAAKIRALMKDQESGIKDALFKELDKVTIRIPILGDLGLVPDVHPMRLPVIGPFLKDVVTKVFNFFIDTVVSLAPNEGREEWLVRIGVNGTWAAFFFEPQSSGNGQRKIFNAFQLEYKLALANTDHLLFAAHGTEFDPVGDIMHSPISNRTLRFRDGSKAQVPWPKLVKPDKPEQLDEFVFDYLRAVMFDTTEGIGKLSLGFDNSPLGLVDADLGSNTGFSQQNNPMVIRDEFEDPLKTQRLARFARAIPPQMILVEDTRDKPVILFPEKPDYDLRYTLLVKDQIPKNPPPT